jgi:hypothetical protein
MTPRFARNDKSPTPFVKESTSLPLCGGKVFPPAFWIAALRSQ